ncbi:hypothetical protein BJY16_005029 [Actinoplanes octamycinicus]|uniref:Uncharacterized protein n=1 Tax=Actinoplanes octamycinicus TaxID=135948 RepID=A0A7W7M984_9ACTN|nr:hypothetical protein [Actinoplanes octamycinicus]MBB4741570.1 hypothetical protein [Actinoplanes octamycinicus]GIE57121.1 hypothetical protein Aoc01nite_25230 [Actinoplanes octamycinicus]
MSKWGKRPNRGPTRPVLTFAETDYRSGAGPLRMIVLRVRWDTPHRLNAEIWYEVDGVEMSPDGRELGRRTALVRGAKLRPLPDNTGHYRSS